MKKKTYVAPNICIFQVNFEGVCATSNRIPIDPTPSTPATNKYESPWSSKQWETSLEG